jgi:polyphosphate kinase
VLYGIEGFKAHCKVCLVTRRERGKLVYYTQIGTATTTSRPPRSTRTFRS